MTKPRLRLVASTTENRTVTPRRGKNGDLRTREYLTIDEVERLIEAAKDNRYGHRDALMVLLAFRHGLRAGEVVDLRWDQIDFKAATLHVHRLKSGRPSTHPLTGRELRALRRHQRESVKSPFVFVSERGAPLSPPGFSRMVERAALAAKLEIKTHAHIATPVVTNWQTTDTIPAHSRLISVTRTSRTPRVLFAGALPAFRRRCWSGTVARARRTARSAGTSGRTGNKLVTAASRCTQSTIVRL
jgi:integrase